MFSLQPNDELVFGNPITSSKGYEICEDLIIDPIDPALTKNNFINFSSDKRVNSGLTRQTREGESDIRVLRRDVERKRRQEMSNLHLTLASLLPTQHKKGKRGVCDQMEEAANYIKTMHNKIQLLKIRRDELITKLSENKMVISDDECMITINQVLPHGMEILIKTVYYEVSPALEVLAERELDVVNCVSTHTNGGFLHKIHIQGCRDMDVSMLQDKLSNAMN